MADKTEVPQVNTGKVLAFLKLFTKGLTEGYLQVEAIASAMTKDDKPDIRRRTVALANLDDLTTFIEQYKEWNLYFRPNLLRDSQGSGKGGAALKTDIIAGTCFHLDFDPNDPPEGMTLDAKREHLIAERERIKLALANFKVSPSFVIDSGGGYQAFWKQQAPAPIGEVEAINQRLCVFFKTPDSCHSSQHLMRLPYTVNRPGYKKLAKGREVVATKLPVKNDKRYTLDDFAFLPTAEATGAKAKAKGKVETDVSDLPKRFRDLLATDEGLQKRWSGNDEGLKEGDRSARDMSITSRLVRYGFNNAVIARILRACPNSKACQDERNDDYINAMISKARYGRVLSATEPLSTAHRFVAEVLTDDDGVPLLRRWNDDYYLWQDGAYKLRADCDVEKLVWEYLEPAKVHIPGKTPKAAAALAPAQMSALAPAAQAAVNTMLAATAAAVKATAALATTASFKVNPTKVRNVEAALCSAVLLTSDVQNPAWIDGATGYDPAELLIMANGILHIPTRELLDHDPRLFSSMALPFAYDPNAKKPEEWLKFLHSLFTDEGGVLDEEAIDTLQEWFGYCLTTKAQHDKILMIIGPKRGGKSTIVRILRALIGEMNCVGSTLDAMADHFGMESMIGKRLVIFPDSRLSSKADMRKLTANVLTASGGDRQSIPRKHKPDWLGQLLIKLMLISNELPKMLDDSEALNSRLIFLHLRKSFSEAEQDKNLTEKLLLELPAILTWSLDGLVRLNSRGYFIQPTSALELVEEMENLTSPIGAFIRDRCVIDPNAWAYKETLFTAWKGYCLSENRNYEGTTASFGVSLRAAVPKLITKKVGPKGAQRSAYFGIGMATVATRVSDDQKRFFDGHQPPAGAETAKTSEIADLDAFKAKKRAELM
ncbi:phage/plasmid primase, P4 family [Pseudomonas sp. VI4.1]|uniref:DNA primase family protein n=1 Tax=Pseudomonas sp. VI4.1 TaxID=1941346 RepID=UPI0009D25A11|nr:phage/plasmid primase, P4 family [Pseudomonas sp. VI4.1]OPK06781.1 hypothetical protein BZ163_29705 [Pseudomonas sp. VI4.1]